MKNPTTIAAQKIEMMQTSILCLTFGLLGLVPVIGLMFALAALLVSARARKSERGLWNPARPHRIAGLICAALGLLVWSVVDTLLIYHQFDPNTGNN